MSYTVIGLCVLVVFGVTLFIVGIMSDMKNIKKEKNRKFKDF